MRTIRYLGPLIAALSVTALGLGLAAPTALAMRVPRAGDPHPSAGIGVAHSDGLATWQVALIAVAVALIAAIATAIISRAHYQKALRSAVEQGTDSAPALSTMG